LEPLRFLKFLGEGWGEVKGGWQNVPNFGTFLWLPI
jgi:hypothetical protein